ncbi:MAG TPA: phosphoenolpyruvate synthase [Polyangiaceae bacterium]|nr:phosphoenolpyruvate synthase [Polyangiaceae bacterium]
MRWIIPFEQVTLNDIAEVGGKNASLGELTQELVPQGIAVPRGFALTAAAFREHLLQAGLREHIYQSLDALDVGNVSDLSKVSAAIRSLIRGASLPKEIASELVLAYQELSRSYGQHHTDVAVRSSATAEDLPTASFAGQHESYLNVYGEAALLDAVRDCMASLFTERAIAYRAERGFDHRKVALSVGVQKMVRSDLGSAGVIFTLDTESGSRDVVIVTSSWGLGESVVKGRVSPDEFWVHKPTFQQGFASLIRREAGDKAVTLVYGEGGATVEQRTDPALAGVLSLKDQDVLTLTRWALAIEQHYSARAGKPTPMDVEWARDGRSGDLFIVQARPETVHAQRATQLESFRLLEPGKVLTHGKSVGSKIGAGKVRVIRDVKDLPSFQPGEVLVAPMTDPDWEPVLRRAAAIVTDQGGRTCHAAIISRELGIPCVAGTHDGTALLTTGQAVTVSCAEGDEGRVYEGSLRFERHEVRADSLPRPRVPVMLNVANPDSAFQVAQLPNAGVGLLRVEFVVGSQIGIHPMALVHPDRVKNADELRTILAKVGDQPDLTRFFVERMARGIGQIAAAFYPRDVIVRFSDFKTNEYAGLLGGSTFEPHEDNPMIGFRGASRYYHERYREGFALECEALAHVREVFGLRNVKLMIPFCRTLKEARRVLDELAHNGLRRGEHDLEIYMMCEIPSNVVLADDFAQLFDGFSIGSNDLTQLTLGIDRDSATLAPLFDEQDPAILRSLEHVVQAAHRHGCKVGICGQAPSDHPEFAKFLAEIGIDTISVTADALPAVCQALALEPSAEDNHSHAAE